MPFNFGGVSPPVSKEFVVNDEEQPENGTPSAAVEQTPVAELNHPATEPEMVEEAFDDEELDGDDLSDDEDLDDAEVVDVRAMVEQLFDDDDLGEVMSELDVLTLEDAAAYLKVEYGQIRRLLKEQGLPGRKIGDEWRFLRGAIADWLRAPGGNAAPVVSAPVAVPAPQRPATPERREFTQKPPLRERFSQGADEGQQQRFPQQGGSRYPQPPQQGGSQGGSRYPQENRPPRRPQNEGYQGGNQGGGGQAGGYQGGGQTGGYQGGGNQGGNQGNQGGQGQGGYPPPRRPRYGNDQEQQQAPQGEYRPPRRPYAGGQGGNQTGGNFSGGAGPGSAGGPKYNTGPKKPKRKALNEQRFDRLDRRRFEDESGQEAPPESNE